LFPHLVGAVRAVLFAPDARDDGLQYLVADRPRRALRGIGLCGFPPEVGGGGDRHHAADRLDPIRPTMLVDEGDHHFGRRSSSACAKNADAFRRISLARFNSTFSRWRRLSSSRSLVVRPERWTASRSAWRTHRRSASTEQPNFSATDRIATHCDGYSGACSNTN